MSEKLDVEVSGWTKEQTAFMLFDRVFFQYDHERPTSIEGALALYAKCLSTVKYASSIELGKRIGKIAD